MQQCVAYHCAVLLTALEVCTDNAPAAGGNRGHSSLTWSPNARPVHPRPRMLVTGTGTLAFMHINAYLDTIIWLEMK